MNNNIDTVIVKDPRALGREAATRFLEAVLESARLDGNFSAALSGGSTPDIMYRLLAEDPYQSQIPWRRVHLFWTDERIVPPDHEQSNYRLVHDRLLRRIIIPDENIHRIKGELEMTEAASDYERQLRSFFFPGQPRFNLVLLGLGKDGHVASLFPGSKALSEVDSLAVPVEVSYEDRPAGRVSLTLPVINRAARIIFLVSGFEKASVVREVFNRTDPALPAMRVKPLSGNVLWLLDEEAASLL